MFEEINRLYKKAFDENGNSASAVLIPRDNQYLRFQSFINFLPQQIELSIIDYGCGLAHLNTYLITHLPYRFRYVGVDINEDFLSENRKIHANSDFYSRDVFFQNSNRADFIVSIGTFNLKYKEDPTANKNFVFSEINRLWEKVDAGLYLNFMSTVVDFQQAGAYHQDLGEVYEYCCKNLSRKIMIDSNYLPYEYSIIILKY